MPKSENKKNKKIKISNPKNDKQKRIDREKISSSKKSEKSSNRPPIPRRSLDPMRNAIKDLVEEANLRVYELRSMGIYTPALSEAERTIRKVHEGGEELFTSELKSRKEVTREFARLTRFMNDETSSIAGAKRFAEYAGAELFGGQFRANGGYGANPEFISEEMAKTVFETYRKVLEHEGGYERVMGYIRAMNPGLSSYGSENLINQIYDIVKEGDLDSAIIETGDYGMSESDLMDYYVEKGVMAVDEMIRDYERIADVESSFEEFGILPQDTGRSKRISDWSFRMMLEGKKRTWHN